MTRRRSPLAWAMLTVVAVAVVLGVVRPLSVGGQTAVNAVGLVAGAVYVYETVIRRPTG